MSEASGIEWVAGDDGTPGATWNPVVGCERISSGCASCYAVRDAWRMGHNPNPTIGGIYGDVVERQPNGQLDWTGVVKCLPERLGVPFRWGKARRVFVNSQSDLFHVDVPDEFIARVFAVMLHRNRHTYIVLTKRPERMATLLGRPDFPELVRAWANWNPNVFRGWWPFRHVWLGVSVENQAAAEERIPHLLRTPAAVRWISAEPLLGPVDLAAASPCGYYCERDDWPGGHHDHPFLSDGDPGISWVVAGGESGPGARRAEESWFRDLRDQCRRAGVAFFQKQMGSVWATEHGADRKGGDPAFWPPDLRVREWPTIGACTDPAGTPALAGA